MTTNRIEIEASTPDEAARHAEQALQAEAGRILLRRCRRGHYQAELLEAKEGVRVRFEPTDLPAAFVRLFRTGWEPPGLDRTKLLGELVRSGLHAEPTDQGLDQLLGELASAEDGGELNFAPVGPARPPEGCFFRLCGDPNRPVFPGQTVAEIRPEAESDSETNGQRLDRGISTEAALCFDGSGCSLDETARTLIARRYGLVRLLDGAVRVEPLLKLSFDACSVSTTIFPFDFLDSAITVDRLEGLLKPFADRLRFQRDTVVEALESAKRTARPHKSHPMAVGKRPAKGKDGVFRLACGGSSQSGEAGGERLDPRERGLFLSLDAGEAIGTLFPPEPGTAGQDVFGNRLPPIPGDLKDLQPGENVEIIGDGEAGQPVTYQAGISGVIAFEGGAVSVSEVLEIPGDVDYSTGNITLERGSVQIAGSVMPGFSLDVPREARIQGMVDDARIAASGNISVQGGIVAEHSGRVQAGGSVQAQFAENVTIEAGGDVVVTQNITNCRIQASGMVLCTSGCGSVQGGTVRSSQGIEVNVAGSKLGVVTKLIIEPDTKAGLALSKEKKELQAQITKIEEKLGGSENIEALRTRLPKDKHEAVSRLLQIRSEAAGRLEEIEAELLELKQQKLESLSAARIKIRRTAYPDTLIVFLNREHQVKEQLTSATFRFDLETRQIVID